jgi:AAA family ATP:ADP antiporter
VKRRVAEPPKRKRQNSLVEAASDAQAAAGAIAIGAERQAFVGQYLAGVYALVNLLGLLIQMLLVSRIFRFFGVRGALFVLPCIAIGGYGLLMAFPMLQIVRIVKIAENSTDYSLMNTIRAALYLPTSCEVKYKAKQAVDTFFVRLGDMLQVGVVFVGIQLGFGIRNFAVRIPLSASWGSLSRYRFSANTNGSPKSPEAISVTDY